MNLLAALGMIAMVGSWVANSIVLANIAIAILLLHIFINLNKEI